MPSVPQNASSACVAKSTLGRCHSVATSPAALSAEKAKASREQGFHEVELARFELATSWVRSARNGYPLVVMLRYLAQFCGNGRLAFAVVRHALPPEFDQQLTMA
jgi:hypothetical protein